MQSLAGAANATTDVGRDLSRLLLRVHGPVPWLRAHLGQVAGVERAVIFGSWAARALGHSGPMPKDLDLLVVGTVAPLDVYEVARAGTKRLGIEINPVVRTRYEWSEESSGFATDVRDGPQIVLIEASDD